MSSILTIAYLLYSLYSSDPLMSDNDFTRSVVSNALTLNPSVYRDMAESKDLWLTFAKVDDFAGELKEIGYFGAESGDAELDLRNAILRFQSNHNLLVDGIWGEQCRKTLVKRILNGTFQYNDTVENPPTNNKWITINKTKRILTLYEGKTILGKHPVAIGNPPFLTPSGKFTIVCKAVDPAWGGGSYAKPVAGGSPENPLGARWLGLSISGGDRYGIHGNNKPYSIGRDISHGCIRMINADVEQLFEIIGISTPVWIGTDAELGQWQITQNEY